MLPVGIDRAETLLEYKDTLLAQHGSSLAFNTAGAFIDFKDTFSPPQAGRRMRAIEANSNYFLTTSEGVKNLSNIDGNFITYQHNTNLGLANSIVFGINNTQKKNINKE